MNAQSGQLRHVNNFSGLVVVASAAAFLCAALSGVVPAAEGAKQVWVEMPSAEAADAMEMIAGQEHANYLRIRTWTGKYAYREVLNTGRGLKPTKFSKKGKDLLVRDPSDPLLVRVHEGSYRFAIRIDTAQLYAEDECPELPRYFEVGTEKPVDFSKIGNHVKIGPQNRRSLQTPEHCVLFEPLLNRAPMAEYEATLGRQQKGAVAERQSPEQAKERKTALPLDPREMYSRDRQTTFWDDSKRLAGFIRDYAAQKQGLPIALGPFGRPRKMAPFRLYRLKDSEIPSFKLAVKFSSGGYTEHIYDGRFAWNQTYFVVKAPAGFKTTEVEWDYQEHDGIFIPKRFEFRLGDHESGVVTLERRYTLVESTLNAPIPDEQFTYAALGMPEDTRVVDRLENRNLLYHKGQLVVPTADMVEVPLPARIAPPARSRVGLLIVVNVLILAAVVAAFGLRYRRRSRLRNS